MILDFRPAEATLVIVFPSFPTLRNTPRNRGPDRQQRLASSLDVIAGRIAFGKHKQYAVDHRLLTELTRRIRS